MTDNEKDVDPAIPSDLDIDLAGSKGLVAVSSDEKTFGKLELIAEASKQIAKMREPRLLTTDMLDSMRIIYPEMSDSKILNTYRELRTKLFSVGKANNFIMMVTSVVTYPENSNISINIGSSFAFDSTKTALLIDSNLANPRLDKIFSIDTDLGLTSFLEDESISLERIIFPTGVHRLRLIPVGARRESSTEYFTSMKMRIFLNTVKKRYPDRFIIVDSPSIGETADAKIIAELCDYILLVVPYGRITEAKLANIVGSLDRSKLIGIVFN